jgi:hypothetical protein
LCLLPQPEDLSARQIENLLLVLQHQHLYYFIMAGGAVISGTADTSQIEAPVTMKAYLMCAFAAFGGVFFGYDTGWMGGYVNSSQ